MNPDLLNGHPKCTLIESFPGRVFVIRPGFKQEFKELSEAKGFITGMGWEINVAFTKGSNIKRRMT
jgi:hypothetical protein